MAFVGEGLDLVNLERCLHVPFESLTTAHILICECLAAQLKLRQEFICQRLLEYFTSLIVTDTIGI